jgi:hypothetical protein
MSLFMTRERAHVQGEIGEKIDALLNLNPIKQNESDTFFCLMDIVRVKD